MNQIQPYQRLGSAMGCDQRSACFFELFELAPCATKTRYNINNIMWDFKVPANFPLLRLLAKDIVKAHLMHLHDQGECSFHKCWPAIREAREGVFGIKL